MSDPSFPSSHAYMSFMVYGLLIGLAAVFTKRRRLRRTLQAVLVLLVLAIGFSRIYLGYHWPSDVLGAYVIGGSFLALLLWGYRRGETTDDRGPRE